MVNNLRGTGVALVTPFRVDLTIDFEAFDKLVEYNLSNGVDYFVVQGTTGESVTLDENEKIALLKRINSLNTGKPIIFGIGGNNTKQVLEQIEVFNEAKFDYVLSVCPYYNKPSQTGLINHFEMIADKSSKPILLYNVPGRTGSNLMAESTAILSQHENIIGIKEASNDFNQGMKIIKYSSKDFMFISGDDLMTIPLISIGAQGVISVLANGLPEIMTKMVNYALQGEFSNANLYMQKILEMNPLMYSEGNPTGVKVILEHLGICSKYVRSPLSEASEELCRKIIKLI